MPMTWIAAALAAVAATGADVGFTRSPTAEHGPDGVRIRFAVSRATDVAVAIEDGTGRVVRHLVAGVLGPNPPKPLTPDAFEQSILWDGTDDLGERVVGAAGRLRVRVSLGLRPRFKRFVGHTPRDLGGVRGMVVGPKGNIYIIHSFGSQHPLDGSASIVVLSRGCRYVRTIAPFPADIPDARLAGLKFIRRRDGTKVPYVYQSETRSFLPGLGDLPSQTPIVTTDGRFAFVGVQEGPRPFAQPGEARLTVIRTDGGTAPGGLLRTLVHPLTDTGAGLALSPDEKTIYAAGVRAGTHPAGPSHNFTCEYCDHPGNVWDHTIPVHCVFRLAWGDPQAKAYIGNPAKAGDDPKHLNHPIDVATDRDGNVYVADLGNNRIAVFKPGGRFAEPIGQIEVRAPQRVRVHRTTGAVYVLAGRKELSVVKFESVQTGREVWRRKVYRSRRAFIPIRRPAMALDDRIDPARVWISRPLGYVEDRGDTPGARRDLWAENRAGPRAMASVMEMSLDRPRGLLYVNNRMRYDVTTWKGESFKLPGGRMWPNSTPASAAGRFAPDGNYYLMLGTTRARVLRFGPDLKPKPFAAGRDIEKNAPGGAIAGPARDHGQGHTADARGNVYALWKKFPSTPGNHYRAYCLNKYGPDGRLLKERLVDASIPGLHAVRVDREGNIYLTVTVRRGKSLLPPGLEGQAPDAPTDPDAVNGVNMYPMMYGSIVKFGPAGGEIREGVGGIRCNYGVGRAIDVRGAEWIAPGASVVTGFSSPKGRPGTVISCVCETPCPDLDGFARVFYTDAARARVRVVDTAGNTVTAFGTYGNADAVGRGATIPLWWPQAVAVGDREAYVGDRLNRRIVVVSLDYAATETARIGQ